MKKITILFILATISLSAFSQKTHKILGWKISKDVPANEVKLNLGTTIFGLYPEVSYERIMDSDISLGASAGIGLGNDDYLMKFSLIPYFRWFFGGNSKSLEKYGSGFFIEANGAVFSRGEDMIYRSEPGGSTQYSQNSKNIVGAGLGLALGWKYLSQNNWVGELYFGGGRDFTNDSGYPRFGISIGKRF